MIVQKVRQQSISDNMNVLSVNGLDITVSGTIWFEPEYKNLGKLIQTKGEDYIRELLNPAINAAAKSVVGRYTPEQLYSSKRDIIELEILEEVRKELDGQYVNVKRVIEAQGKADANRILSASLTDKILQDKGIEATVKLSESSNSKVIVIGSGDSGMPIILGNQ